MSPFDTEMMRYRLDSEAGVLDEPSPEVPCDEQTTHSIPAAGSEDFETEEI